MTGRRGAAGDLEGAAGGEAAGIGADSPINLTSETWRRAAEVLTDRLCPDKKGAG